ncbi:MAG: AMP-binding protein, partial [Rhodocyclaceae bacterium]|nr:AMP-binding protein [Rhodocyclaceae bacterium]
MPSFSRADYGATPPRVEIPRDYNAAHDLIERNLAAGRRDRIAYIDDAGEYTFGDLAERADRCGNALLGLGLRPEERVLLCLHDGIDFPAVFLGAIKAGIVPVAVNTLLPAQDLEHLLRDSRARAAVVSPALLPRFRSFAHRVPTLKALVVAGPAEGDAESLAALAAAAADRLEPADTCCDEACFWIYSSGSTG